MDPKDFFRGFFGMPPRQPGMYQPPGFQMPSEQESDDGFENPLSPEKRNDNPGFRGSFRVFTNPLEMESFFSQQFDEMLKQFGGGGNFSGIFGEGAIPKEGVEFSEGLRESHENSREEENSRDFMLRKDDNPGYLRPDNSKERHDVEVDHLPEDFGKFHAPGPSHIEPQPDSRHNNHQGFTKTFNFGQSFSSSSVRLQDGSIEEKQVTKDNEGRETTTVIKKSGEDCYTVTTIKHPDGREERQESNSCPQLNDFSRSFSGQLGSLARESIVALN